MRTCIKKMLANSKVQQWLWFIALWLLGLASVFALTIPIKLLIKACQ